MDNNPIDESKVNQDFATLQSYVAGRRMIASSDPRRFLPHGAPPLRIG
jgi:hypothetical protein